MRDKVKMQNEDGFILPHGGYRELLSYQKAIIVFDATVRFCERFFHKFDRTVDQMVQAARSGKQNIVEGSKASGTSKKSEIKLTAVARASLEELLEDYQDFLRLATCRCGTKTAKRPGLCVGWGCKNIRPMRPISPMSSSAARKHRRM